jgi:hypothetical protein
MGGSQCWSSPCTGVTMNDDIKTRFNVGDFIVWSEKQVVEVTEVVERGLVAWLVYPARSHQHLIEWDNLEKNYRLLKPEDQVIGGYIRNSYFKIPKCYEGFWPTRYDQAAMNKVKIKVDGD